jgi:hypothetical protein
MYAGNIYIHKIYTGYTCTGYKQVIYTGYTYTRYAGDIYTQDIHR